MAKYSFEFKKMIVKEYLEGKGSTRELARKYHIGCCDNKQVVKWVASYKAFGDDGLLRSRQQKILFRIQKICGRVIFIRRSLVSGISFITRH